MSRSVRCSGPWSVHVSGAGLREGAVARHASLLIALLGLLLAALLIATPPLALLTVPPDPTTSGPLAPVQQKAVLVSQLA